MLLNPRPARNRILKMSTNINTIASLRSQAYILAFFLFSLFLVSNLQAQEEFVPPPAKLLTSVPFRQFTGGVILLKGRLGNYPDSLNFILDTGNGGISLDSLPSERLKIKSEPSDKTIRGIAGIRTVRFV